MAEQPILVTGAAGFIGFHVARRLLGEGRRVVGLDNLNDYYDVALKEARLAILTALPGFTFVKADLADRAALENVFDATKHGSSPFAAVIHLAAQAGVRYSIDHPHAYADANLVGFLNVLEGCRAQKCPHLIYASSSSVYGANETLPFSEHDNVDHPVSLYAATKKANELMAHAYSHLYKIPATGLRFFTVYGPWGRPDMAAHIFATAIATGKPIRLFNSGKMQRDFTYIDDIVEGVVRLIDHPPQGDTTWNGAAPDPASSKAPWRVYNIGNNKPENIVDLVTFLEAELGRKAIVELAPMQPGDVPATYATIDDLNAVTGFRPATPLKDGIRAFAAWYRDYYRC